MEKGSIDVLGPRERRKDATFVVLTANLLGGQHRYVTGEDGVLLAFETADAAIAWATEREPAEEEVGRLLVVQVPQRAVIDKALSENRTVMAVMENGEWLDSGAAGSRPSRT
jgi:hypothetical protein